jgi:aminoglycoside phosphotransferase (APT) family kinase protein
VEGDIEPSVELVRVLLQQQFPQWADLEVREVSSQGWDNRTFRLGTDLSVRLPSAEGYAPQVEREHRWLPYLGRALPTTIASPVAKGAPSPDFRRAWSVYRWLDGVPLDQADSVDLTGVAVDLAAFLRALEAVPVPSGAPSPEPSNGFRGGAFDRYVDEGQDAVSVLDAALQQQAGRWLEEATESQWSCSPVWVHGDVAAGNLLARDGRLGAVIDFGCLAVGDPACDLTVAWTVLDGPGRAAFRHHVGHDDDTWRRARGWAVWKAAITLLAEPAGSSRHRDAARTVRELWSDPA